MNQKMQWLRNQMSSMDLQGMIVSNPVNIRYLTNIKAEGVLLVTRKENIFLTDGRYIEEVHNTLTLFDEIVVYDKNSIREDATRAQYLIKGNGKAKILLTGDIVKDNIITRLFGSSSRGIKTNQMRYRIYEGEDKWAALNNRYFAIISSPANSNDTVFETMTFSEPSSNEYRNDFHIANLVSKHNIKKGSSITDNYSVYMGPKVRSIFSNYYAEESYESIFGEYILRPFICIL